MAILRFVHRCYMGFDLSELRAVKSLYRHITTDLSICFVTETGASIGWFCSFKDICIWLHWFFFHMPQCNDHHVLPWTALTGWWTVPSLQKILETVLELPLGSLLLILSLLDHLCSLAAKSVLKRSQCLQISWLLRPLCSGEPSKYDSTTFSLQQTFPGCTQPLVQAAGIGSRQGWTGNLAYRAIVQWSTVLQSANCHRSKGWLNIIFLSYQYN